MDQFVSTFTNKIDTKGRVSVRHLSAPSSPRTALTAFYRYPSLDAPALDAGGQRLVDKINRLVEDLAPYSDERDHLATALFGTSEILTIDQDGRAVLPERLREHAGITTHITFVGLGEKFQMWEPKRFEVHLSEARKCATSARYSARAVAEAAGQREHGNDGGQRQFDCRRRTGPPSSRDALGSSDALEPKNGAILIDGTFGAGGYTEAILDTADCKVIAIDRDPDAIVEGAPLAARFRGRLMLVNARYSDMDAVAAALGLEAFDGVALDLGVSSMQLDRSGARLLLHEGCPA